MELSLDRLTKQYGRKIAVDCVSATLKPGVYGLLGANGAGKTIKRQFHTFFLPFSSLQYNEFHL